MLPTKRLSQAHFADYLDISVRTFARWRQMHEIGIPPPDDVILGRPFWSLATVKRFERERAKAACKPHVRTGLRPGQRLSERGIPSTSKDGADDASNSAPPRR